MNSDFSTCDLYDEDESLQSLPLQMQNLGGLQRFTGPIRTVRCYRDNGLLKSILNGPGDGAVLVVDGDGSLESALMGDMIAEAALANSWTGVVINGAVRDKTALSQLTIGVRALGTNPRKSAKQSVGEADSVLSFGGVTFRPGATLWSDEDGILVTA